MNQKSINIVNPVHAFLSEDKPGENTPKPINSSTSQTGVHKVNPFASNTGNMGAIPS